MSLKHDLCKIGTIQGNSYVNVIALSMTLLLLEEMTNLAGFKDGFIITGGIFHLNCKTTPRVAVYSKR
jgi:hypothetical protein